MVGRTFGRLTVERRDGSTSHGEATWLVRCYCGERFSVLGANVRRGLTVSCGCSRREALARSRRKHGRAKTPEYNSWQGMISRCENVNNSDFANYGGRGIRVCERWRESFEAFFADMGPRPTAGHSVDRVDVNGNYVLDNCRWSTQRQQQRNRRNNRWITAHGITLTLAEWSERTGIRPGVILRRLKIGWKPDDAVGSH